MSKSVWLVLTGSLGETEVDVFETEERAEAFARAELAARWPSEMTREVLEDLDLAIAVFVTSNPWSEDFQILERVPR